MAGEGPPSVRTVWRNPPSAIRVLARGLLRRCPRCGQGKLFLGWFTLRERCQRCDLRLQREEGGFLGAMVINYAVTMVAWMALLVAWLVVDLPEVRVALLLLHVLRPLEVGDDDPTPARENVRHDDHATLCERMVRLRRDRVVRDLQHHASPNPVRIVGSDRFLEGRRDEDLGVHSCEIFA